MKTIGFLASIILPLWDIPLIMLIIKRKSSQDISLSWAFGIWLTAVLMTPSAFLSGEKAAIGFNVVNVIMLTAVLIVVFKYRKGVQSA